MEKMLAVVVDNEAKAYEALRALKELDEQGSVSIYAEVVIQKNTDGTVSTKEIDSGVPIRAVGGTAIGGLIGVLGGPIGIGVGVVSGGLAGLLADLYASGISAAFVDDVVSTLIAGKFALIADIEEDWVTPVDVRMEAAGGMVFRSSKNSVEAAQRAREAEQLRLEIEQAKAELARAHADRKAKLQAKLDKLTAQLQAQIDQARHRAQQLRAETEAKIQAVERKAENAQAEVKARLVAQVTQIRRDFEETDAQFRHVAAESLRKAAARLDNEPARRAQG